jgi:hypothetical protein
VRYALSPHIKQIYLVFKGLINCFGYLFVSSVQNRKNVRPGLAYRISFVAFVSITL